MSVVEGTGSVSVIPVAKWSVDASRSSVAFALKHMVFATVKGRFREFDGILEAGGGGRAPPGGGGGQGPPNPPRPSRCATSTCETHPTSLTSSAIRRSAST